MTLPDLRLKIDDLAAYIDLDKFANTQINYVWVDID